MNAELREIARDNWRFILNAAGVDDNLLDGKHHACPICKDGKDCFRFDDLDGRGTYICNKCGAGDGVKFLMKVKNCSFNDAAKFVRSTLGIKSDYSPNQQHPKQYFKSPEQLVSAWDSLPMATPTHPYLQRKGINSYLARQNGDELIIPVQSDLNGTVVSAQRIMADKNKSGNDKFIINGTALKGNFCLLGKVDDDTELLLFAEGFATGATIHQATDKPVVICFISGNIKSVVEKLRDSLPNTRFLLCADADKDGKSKAKYAAKRFNCQWVAPDFINHESDSATDFNDLAQLAGLDLVSTQLQTAMDNTLSPESQARQRFILEGGCVQYASDPDEGNYRRICGQLEVVANTRDEFGQNYGKLLRFVTQSGYACEWVMPMNMLSGDASKLVGFLMSMGLYISSPEEKEGRKLIARYINTRFASDTLTTTEATGWHGQTFVLTGGEQIGTGDKVIFTGIDTRLYSSKGTIQEWRDNVAKLAINNSRLEFALSLAFVGVMMPLTGDDGAGCNFFGETSSGKSTTQIMSGSVWGNPIQGGFISKWNATQTGLEVQAVQRNHTLFCVDELGEVEPKIAGRLIYQLASGVQKGRGKPSDNGVIAQAESKTWKMPFISSGEKTLQQHVDEAGQRLYGGQSVRCVDIPADAGKGLGVFDDTQGLLEKHNKNHQKAGEEFAILIKKSSELYYGTAGREFIAKLLKFGIGDALKFVQNNRKSFNHQISANASPLARRAAKLFSLTAAVGELAIHLEILPWEAGSAQKSALRCFQDWLAENADGNPERNAALAQVRYFLEQNQEGRFTSWNGIDKDVKVQQHAGWIDRREKEGVTFYIKTEIFKRDVCKGYAPKFVIKVLEDKGVLVCSEGRKQLIVRDRESTKKVYAISEKIFDDDAG